MSDPGHRAVPFRPIVSSGDPCVAVKHPFLSGSPWPEEFADRHQLSTNFEPAASLLPGSGACFPAPAIASAPGGDQPHAACDTPLQLDASDALQHDLGAGFQFARAFGKPGFHGALDAMPIANPVQRPGEPHQPLGVDLHANAKSVMVAASNAADFAFGHNLPLKKTPHRHAQS